jgi:hypothetical protein
MRNENHLWAEIANMGFRKYRLIPSLRPFSGPFPSKTPVANAINTVYENYFRIDITIFDIIADNGLVVADPRVTWKICKSHASATSKA